MKNSAVRWMGAASEGIGSAIEFACLGDLEHALEELDSSGEDLARAEAILRAEISRVCADRAEKQKEQT